MIREDDLAVSSRELCDTSGPYVFISYAHKDSKKVIPILRGMHNAGIRLWFDGGLEAGTEWQNGIADHLEQCSVFLCFVSENSIVSENCKNEIAFANSNLSKSIRHCLYIYEDEALEEKIDSGSRMYMIRHQKMYMDRHSSLDSVLREILVSPIFDICKRDDTDKGEADVSAKTDKKIEADTPQKAPSVPEKTIEKPKKTHEKSNPLPVFLFSLINMLLILGCAVYLPIALGGTDITNLGGAWVIVCAMAVSTLVLSIVLFAKRKQTSDGETHPYLYALIPVWALSVAALLWLVYITRNCPFSDYIAIYIAFVMLLFSGWRYLHNTFGWCGEGAMWIAFALGIAFVLYLPVNDLFIAEYVSAESFVNVLKNIGIVLLTLLKWIGQLLLLVIGGGFWLPSFYDGLLLSGPVLNTALYVWFAFFVMATTDMPSSDT